MKINKLYMLLDLLNKKCTVHSEDLNEWDVCVSKYTGFKQYSKIATKKISIGEVWGGLFETGIFTKQITIPQNFNNYSVYIDVVTGGEAQLFVNGKAFSGNDPNHNFIKLSGKCYSGSILDIKIESYVKIFADAIGNKVPDDSSSGTLKQARIVAIDENVRELVFDIYFLLDMAQNYTEYTNAIEDFVSNIFYNLDIYDSIDVSTNASDIRAEIDKFIKTIPIKNKDLTVTFIGQSHLDMAWLWRKCETYRKVVRTFSTVVNMMEQYPFYKFSMPQLKLFSMLKEQDSALYNTVKLLIKQGRIEATGAMYLEPDTNLPKGESLVRQILAGRKVLDDLECATNTESLIDSFGYSGNIPQILKKSGIDNVMVTKMRWYNDTTQFPYTLFNWVGIDGTAINAATMPWFNKPCTTSELSSNIDKNLQTDVKNIPVFFGWGDGGGGSEHNRHLAPLERQLKWSKLANVQATTISEYFNSVSFKNMPEYKGEIYQEGHRGCYTTQSNVKKNNRYSEELYRKIEFLCGYLKLIGKDDCYKDIEKYYELLLCQQFHDVLPGSANAEVYKDTASDFESIISNGENMLKTLADNLSKLIRTNNDNTIVVWNFSGGNAAQKANFSIDSNVTIIDNCGNKVKCDYNDGVIEFLATNVPTFSYKLYTYEKIYTIANNIIHELENDFYYIDGENIFDKQFERNIPFSLWLYYDFPQNCDAWDIDIDYMDSATKLNASSISNIFDNGYKKWVDITYRTKYSSIIQRVIIYNDVKLIEFKYFIDWHENHKLLKLKLEPNIACDFATFDVPFGLVKRSTLNDTPAHKAQFEVPAISFAHCGDDTYGIALVSKCKNGYSAKEGVMTVSLLRSSKEPDNTADIGKHEFSINVHIGDVESTVNISRAILSDAICSLQNSHDGMLCESLFSCNAPNVIIDTLKISEDKSNLVLRIYESCGKSVDASIKSNLEFAKIYEANLIEEKSKVVGKDTNTISFHITPYEIKTYILEIK